jgi:hypothetical protein
MGQIWVLRTYSLVLLVKYLALTPAPWSRTGIFSFVKKAKNDQVMRMKLQS